MMINILYCTTHFSGFLLVQQSRFSFRTTWFYEDIMVEYLIFSFSKHTIAEQRTIIIEIYQIKLILSITGHYIINNIFFMVLRLANQIGPGTRGCHCPRVENHIIRPGHQLAILSMFTTKMSSIGHQTQLIIFEILMLEGVRLMIWQDKSWQVLQ